MAASIRHRGPDGEGLWINPSALTGLAHRRLSIIDLSRKKLRSPCCQVRPDLPQARGRIIPSFTTVRYIIILNSGKSSNGRAIRFATSSDTEVILAAYDHYGEECVDHFDGMFAFAIWDEEEQGLFAAGDRFGEKPFYYFFNGRRIGLCVRNKAIWCGGVKRSPNLQMLF